MTDLEQLFEDAQANRYRLSWQDDCPKCPVCGAVYTSANEVRAEIRCIACTGVGEKAAAVSKTLDAALEKATQEHDHVMLEKIGKTFFDSYFGFEARVRLRHQRKANL